MKNTYGNPITLGVIVLLAIAVFQAPKIIDSLKPSAVVPQPIPRPVAPTNDWATQIKAVGLTQEHNQLMAAVLGGVLVAVIEDGKMDEPRIATTADAAELLQRTVFYSLEGQLLSDLYPGISKVSQQVGRFINPSDEAASLDDPKARSRVVEAFAKYQEAFLK